MINTPLLKVTFLVALLSTCHTLKAQVITTFAGSGPACAGDGSFGGDGGPATAANLSYTSDMIFDAADNLYVADWYNDRIRKITPAGIITTFAGAGGLGFNGDGLPATATNISWPERMFIDAAGNLVFNDHLNSRIRRVTTAGIVETIAGTGAFGFAGDGGPASAAVFDNVSGVQGDAAGNLYIIDWGNKRLRKINALTGIITTVAGNGAEFYMGDGGPATATGISPTCVLPEPSGSILVADPVNHRIRRINTAGIISTFAGTGTPGSSGDGGPASLATFNYPCSLIYDPSGNIIVTEDLGHRIRKIDHAGIVTTIAGTGVSGLAGDGAYPIAAQLCHPVSVIFDASGNMLISDRGNHRVRKIDFTATPGPVAVLGLPQLAGISIYPNPATDEINLSHLAHEVAYTITTMDGRQLLTGVLSAHPATIATSELPPGAYIMHLTAPSGQRRTLSFIKH